MLLKGKTAVVFGVTGEIGKAVARRFRAEGASVHISGRDPVTLQTLAEEIGAIWRRVDATDESAVQAYFDNLSDMGAVPDITFNAIGLRPMEADYGRPAAALSRDAFLRPFETIAWSQFLTSRTAATLLASRGKTGAIVTLSASVGAQFVPFMSGIAATCGAIESFTRSLAAELGGAGIRINCVRAGAMPETRTIRETSAAIATLIGTSEITGLGNLLQRPLQLDETAKAIAFYASDHASGITGQIVNVCAGALVS